MWLLKRNKDTKTIHSTVSNNSDGSVTIDVRGQTCPGYLLSINKSMDTLEQGTKAHLLTTYAPCGKDVKAWCKEKGYTYEGLKKENARWKITVLKGKAD